MENYIHTLLIYKLCYNTLATKDAVLKGCHLDWSFSAFLPLATVTICRGTMKVLGSPSSFFYQIGATPATFTYRGYSSTAERQPSKLTTRDRHPLSAPLFSIYLAICHIINYPHFSPFLYFILPRKTPDSDGLSFLHLGRAFFVFFLARTSIINVNANTKFLIYKSPLSMSGFLFCGYFHFSRIWYSNMPFCILGFRMAYPPVWKLRYTPPLPYRPMQTDQSIAISYFYI